jgi:hypothetical protein
MIRLDVRKIKDCQQTTLCADDQSLSITCFYGSKCPTLVREQAHPLPRTIEVAAKYPTIASFIQLEGAAAFTLVYLEVKERLISDDVSIMKESADLLLALSRPGAR